NRIETCLRSKRCRLVAVARYSRALGSLRESLFPTGIRAGGGRCPRRRGNRPAAREWTDRRLLSLSARPAQLGKTAGRKALGLSRPPRPARGNCRANRIAPCL